MNISILIPVSNDLRLKRCILSIDEEVEVVISLNHPSPKVLKLTNELVKKQGKADFKSIKIKVCLISYPSIAGAYNNGIKNASYNNILLMDSDCIFTQGCIRQLYSNFRKNKLSKGRVQFNYNNIFEKIVAKAREFHTSDFINAYSPPLLFKKSIKPKIGGYYFHPALCWMEDGEFDYRVRKAHLGISYDPSAVIIHEKLSFIRDLKSAFWYGVGRRIGIELNLDEKPTGLLGSIKKYLIGGAVKKGILVGLYLIVWRYILFTGYYIQKYFHIRPLLNN